MLRIFFFFFSSRRRHTRFDCDWSSDVCSSDLNPLASIRSSVEQLGRAKRANADEKFLTSLVVRESDRLSRLLSEFLDFSRVRATECRPLDLHTVAGAAIRLVREHPDCPADAVIDLAGGATPMEGDEDLLHRVVSNLVLNAVQAGGKDARVVVRTGRPGPQEVPGGAGIERTGEHPSEHQSPPKLASRLLLAKKTDTS